VFQVDGQEVFHMPNTGDHNDTTTAYRLTVRFGDEILQAGFTTVPNLLLRYQATLTSSSSELNFVLQVWYHWWDQKDPYPALGTIAERIGQSRRQVRRYSESLRDKGFLIVRERRETGLGQVTSEYDFAPLLERLRQLYREEQAETTRGRTHLTAPPRTHLTEGGGTDLSEAPRTSMSPEKYIEQEDEGSKNTHREEDEGSSSTDFDEFASTQQPREPSGLSKQVPSDATPRQAQRARSSGMTAIGQIVARPRSTSHQDASRRSKMPPETANKGPDEESAGSTPAPPSQAQIGASGTIQSAAGRGQKRDAPPKLPPYLEDLVARHSEELHDPDHVPQNLGQAGRLWKQSGWSESAFSQALTEAKAITLRRDVKKRATVGGEFGARNKMPYYFKVLRDLLGMKEGPTP